MNETELVSVVVPCYTRGHFVHQTIESIQRQTHTRWEVILVDDAGMYLMVVIVVIVGTVLVYGLTATPAARLLGG